MSLNEKILEQVEKNPDLTISKLAMQLGEPRGKISALVNSLVEEQQLDIVEIQTSKVLRRKQAEKKEVVQ